MLALTKGSISENLPPPSTCFLGFIDEIERMSCIVISEQDRAKIEMAYLLAERYFVDQKRDNNTSAFSHCERVALISSNFRGIKIDDLIVALLHDTIEDTGITYAVIESLFGKKVADRVLSLSKKKWNHFLNAINKNPLNKDENEYLKIMQSYNSQPYEGNNILKLVREPDIAICSEIKKMARIARNDEYFGNIYKLPKTDLIVKLSDRLDALYTMGDIDLEKTKRKIEETITYILPIAMKEFPMIYDIMVRKINSTIEEKKLNIEIIKLVGNISYTEESFVKILKKIEKDFFGFEEIKSYFFQRVEDII